MIRACALLCCVLTLSFLAFGADLNPSDVRTGLYRGRPVTYLVINGKNIFEGDIVLEQVEQSPNGNENYSLGLAYTNFLWPKVGSVYQVPYTINPASGDLTNLNAALSQFNATFPGVIQFVQRSSETDYVDFNFDAANLSGVCDAFVGRIGGVQTVGGSGACTVATVLHEMGHTIGLWHEQSRADRDTYVSVNYNNIIKGSRSNFDQLLDNDQAITLYDYASIMHYPAFSFSRNGGPAIESIPAGIPLSNPSGYTVSDIDGISRLYGSIPTQITVTSNPLGLQLIVDGNTITTPQTFPWVLNSSHTLAVPSGPQTLGGINYIYGRWSDSTVSSHSVTVTPGNGMLTQPPSAPAATVYSANFIQLVPYANAISPGSAGTMTPTPAPQSFPPLSGQYYIIRQPVTLTATPSGGQNFYAYLNSPFWLPGPLSANPKTFYVMEDGTGINLTTYFTSSPVYTVTANPAASGVAIRADGNFWLAPKNFALPYDPSWTSSSQHSVGFDSPQLPYSSNTRYEFLSWNDGGTQTHNVNLPASSTTYTANVTPQFLVADYVLESCAGAIGVTPGSPTGDGFYPSGSLVSFQQTPNTGWTFTGWLFDLTGTANPQNLTVNDEVLVAADYSTTATRLQLTSISPPNAVAGGPAFTLTINGQGFTSSTAAYINGLFRAPTFVNSTKLTVTMMAQDIALPGAFQVAVGNFPSGAACAAFIPTTFFVLISSGTSASVSPGSLNFGKLAAGSTSSSQTVTLTNTGSNPLNIGSITASGGFTEINSCPGSLNGGSNCTINVTFAPIVPTAVTGALTFNDNAGSSPQLVTLTGTGLAPLTFKPASLNLGSVAVGNSSTKTVTVTNNETTALSLGLAAGGNYSVNGGTCGATLAGKASCTVSVKFQPTASGAINGALTISDNSPFTPQVVALAGTGTGGLAVPLSFSPATVSFAATGIGVTSAAKTVTVTNTSASAVTINALATGGNFAAAGSGGTPCGGSLGAGAKCTFAVTFTPSITGSVKGAVAIATSGAGSPQTLNLSGSGSLPVSLSPASLSFGAQAVGTTSGPKMVTLTNSSGAVVTISSIVTSGDFGAAPSGTKPCGNTVAAGAKCTFSVTFTPNATGSISGAATVTHSAPLGPAVIKLTGTGQ
jgi:hypothetical protein